MEQQDKSSGLSPEVVQSLTEQMSEAVLAYSQFKESFDSTMAQVQRQLAAFTEEVRPFFNALSAIDWAKVDSSLKQETMRLAELGWTILPWMTISEVRQLVSLEADSLDEEFTKFYFDEGGLAKAQTVLLASNYMESWRPLLREVFVALERRDHLIAIPSLLLILEGFTAQFVDPTNVSLVQSTKVTRMLEEVRLSHRTNSVSARVWASTMAFLSQLYKRSSFSEQCPSFINRHWILHGRNAISWRLADGLRVLSAICTLHWLITVEHRQLQRAHESS